MQSPAKKRISISSPTSSDGSSCGGGGAGKGGAGHNGARRGFRGRAASMPERERRRGKRFLVPPPDLRLHRLVPPLPNAGGRGPPPRRRSRGRRRHPRLPRGGSRPAQRLLVHGVEAAMAEELSGTGASSRLATSAPPSAIRKLASSPSTHRPALRRFLTAQISIRVRSKLVGRRELQRSRRDLLFVLHGVSSPPAPTSSGRMPFSSAVTRGRWRPPAPWPAGRCEEAAAGAVSAVGSSRGVRGGCRRLRVHRREQSPLQGAAMACDPSRGIRGTVFFVRQQIFRDGGSTIYYCENCLACYRCRSAPVTPLCDRMCRQVGLLCLRNCRLLQTSPTTPSSLPLRHDASTPSSSRASTRLRARVILLAPVVGPPVHARA
ncbi:unnamed protein product [Urochloa humidicola]